MEKHRCKLCSRTFANGRALGGHMKAHLATLPLPAKTTPHYHHQLGSGDRADSVTTFSSSSSYSGEEEQSKELHGTIKSRELAEEKGLAYGLRENPRKSFRLADPEFSSSTVVVQHRESETESKNPTRRRSRRTRKSGFGGSNENSPDSVKKLKLKVEEESPEAVSSVSDTSPDEDVAFCLMMLSRDAWKRNDQEQEQEQKVELKKEPKSDEEEEEMVTIKVGTNRSKLKCEKCKKMFRSLRALGPHKRICSLNVTEQQHQQRPRNLSTSNVGISKPSIFECPYCFKVFGSGQALGGHKRSHLMCSSSSNNSSMLAASAPAAASTSAAPGNSVKFEYNFIDLNMPAPIEDDEFSVVSEA